MKKSTPLLICSFLLIIIGIITIATASAPFAINKGLSSNYYLIHQLLYGFLPGIILGLVAFFTPLKLLRKLAFPFFAISILLMFAVFIPGIGICEKGACRWINAPNFTFQPSELLKLTTIIYLSAFFSNEKRKKYLLNFIITLGIVCLAFFLQKDLSTCIIVGICALTIFFCANTKKRETLLVSILGFIFSLISILITPFRMDRIDSLFGVSTADKYHKMQLEISIGSGGLNGSGLGLSAQKFGHVPEAMSDSIFAIYAEELGFIGCAFLIIIFMSFVFSSFKIAKKAEPFGKLLVIGLTTWIIVQASINILAMSGLLPISGIPLPFLSYGGTHIIFELIALGLILNVSKTINNK